MHHLAAAMRNPIIPPDFSLKREIIRLAEMKPPYRRSGDTKSTDWHFWFALWELHAPRASPTAAGVARSDWPLARRRPARHWPAARTDTIGVTAKGRGDRATATGLSTGRAPVPSSLYVCRPRAIRSDRMPGS